MLKETGIQVRHWLRRHLAKAFNYLMFFVLLAAAMTFLGVLPDPPVLRLALIVAVWAIGLPLLFRLMVRLLGPRNDE